RMIRVYFQLLLELVERRVFSLAARFVDPVKQANLVVNSGQVGPAREGQFVLKDRVSIATLLGQRLPENLVNAIGLGIGQCDFAEILRGKLQVGLAKTVLDVDILRVLVSQGFEYFESSCVILLGEQRAVKRGASGLLRRITQRSLKRSVELGYRSIKLPLPPKACAQKHPGIGERGIELHRAGEGFLRLRILVLEVVNHSQVVQSLARTRVELDYLSVLFFRPPKIAARGGRRGLGKLARCFVPTGLLSAQRAAHAKSYADARGPGRQSPNFLPAPSHNCTPEKLPTKTLGHPSFTRAAVPRPVEKAPHGPPVFLVLREILHHYATSRA